MVVMLMRSMVMVVGDNKELLAKGKVVIMVLLNLDDHKDHDNHDADEGLELNWGKKGGMMMTIMMRTQIKLTMILMKGWMRAQMGDRGGDGKEHLRVHSTV